MSLINKMLQELDRRHAPQAAPGQSDGLARHVRAVKSARMSEWFWYSMAACMLVAVAWSGWMMWQMRPRSLVTDLVFESRRAAGAPRPAIPTGPPPVAPLSAVPAGQPAKAAAEPPGATLPPPAASAQAAEPARVDMLRMATELATPLQEPATRVAKAAKAEPAKLAKADEKPAGDGGRASAGRIERPAAAPPMAQAAEKPPTAARGSPGSADTGRIDRRVNATPRERADSEYRRAVQLVNQGRVAEGMDGLRASLQADPTHDTVRQTLVALLLEARRVDEAASLLQEGLAQGASNPGFAMLLARILVDRKEVGSALAVLQKHAGSARNNAEYHAFLAALHQRVGQHAEAIEEYHAALRLAPGNGAWWVGLGISQQALDRFREALEAYRRAKATGNLSPELVTFADQRVRLLQ